MKFRHHNGLRVTVLGAVMTCVMAVSAYAAETGVISADVVNARKGPDTSYDRVEMLAKGKQVTILGEENGWYKIKWNNSTGYVSKSLVAVSGGDAAQETNATITGGTINIRSGPGTDSSRVAVVSSGKRVAVLEQSGDWFHISFDGKTGYVLGSYLIQDGSSAPAVAAPAASVAPVGNASIIGGSTVNVRSGPGTDYSRVAMVSSGKRVTLLAEEGGWFKVEFDGRTGYVLGDYLTPDDGALDALVAAESEPAAESAAQEPIPAGSAEASAVESGATGQSPDGAATRTGIINGGTINVRSGPGTEFDRVAKVTTGKKVTILGEENGWYQISFGGTTGYVLSEYLFEGDSFPASSVGEQIVAMAMQYLGTRYVYGGSSPSGFDCSGFTKYLYKQFGYSLPHTASGQYANYGVKVSKADLQPGDLVFFTSPGNGGRINHVGLYMGGGSIIHARYSVGEVHINSFSESYYSSNYAGAIRIL